MRILLAALFLAAAALAGGQSLSVPEPVAPGGLIRLYLADAPREAAVLVQLLDAGDKPVLSGRGFYWPELPGQVILLGAPSTLRPGGYRLVVSLGGIERPLLLETSLTVSAKSFIREELGLDQALSELREKPDPRKTREALELYRALADFQADSLFHPGGFGKPVEAERRTSFFGDRRTYRYSDGGTAGAIHAGIDYAAPVGTPVRAAAAGRVALAASMIITGNTLVIEHLPGVFSLYFHMDAIEVEPGEIVEAGRVVGTVGASGLATGPHLHWEVRVQGVAIDPEALLGRPILDKRR